VCYVSDSFLKVHFGAITAKVWLERGAVERFRAAELTPLHAMPGLKPTSLMPFYRRPQDMRQQPNLPEDTILACLRTHYDLDVIK
jgi:hypothetical protein